MTTQQAAGYKAAHTRQIGKITQQHINGELTERQAAGKKAAATRRLNKALAG